MAADEYDTLAGVYDWLVPDALLSPEGAVAAFASVADSLAPGARVLDCAAGTGQLAVGLALRGFDVVASGRFWPFTADELDADLRSAGLAPATTTYGHDVERYMITAVRAPSCGRELA